MGLHWDKKYLLSEVTNSQIDGPGYLRDPLPYQTLLDVKTRQIIYIRMEQIWLLLMPLLPRRHGADVAACALRDVVMVDADVADQGVVQVLAGMAAVGGQDLGEAAVAARDPAVGLGVARCDEAMRDGVGGADAIERVLTGRCALAGGAAPVGERLVVVGQDLSHLERGGLEEAFEKALGAGGGLCGKNRPVDPAPRAIEGDAPVATRRRVGHVR